MDVVKRTALLTALEAGSITAAADRLGYTQSGLSYTISALETEVGFPLLHRSRSGVTPTAECLRLLPMMQDLERRDAQLDQEIAELRGVLTGTLSLATFHSIGRFFLPKLLRRFVAQYPGVSVNLLEEPRNVCIQLLRTGEADLALISHYPEDPFTWTDFCSDEIMVILPADHPLAGQPGLPLDALSGEDFILEPEHYHYNDDVRGILRGASFTPCLRFASKDELVILEMVREGLGISLMPRIFLEPLPAGIAAVPLAPRAYRQLGIACVSQSELSPAARRFLELARATLCQTV